MVSDTPKYNEGLQTNIDLLCFKRYRKASLLVFYNQQQFIF